MYSLDQIASGLENPRRIQLELIKKRDLIRSYRGLDYAITGAYYGGNIGDRAISLGIKNRLKKDEKRVGLFNSNIKKTNSKVHVLGGGGVLRDCRAAAEGTSADSLRSRLDWVSKNEKGAIIGVGVPGLKTKEARKLARKTLPEVDLITVRDQWSSEKMAEFYDGEVQVTACPAFLLEDPRCDLSERTGVNFRPWPNYPSEVMSYHFDYDSDIDVEDARSQYIQNAQQICKKLVNPVFIPFNSEDVIFAQRHLNIDVLPYKFSVKKTLKRISSVNKMVSMRYHSLVFSAITNTPVLVIAYQPKVSHLANRLDVESYLPHEKEIPIVFEKPSNVSHLKHLASRNFQLMYEL